MKCQYLCALAWARGRQRPKRRRRRPEILASQA